MYRIYVEYIEKICFFIYIFVSVCVYIYKEKNYERDIYIYIYKIPAGAKLAVGAGRTPKGWGSGRGLEMGCSRVPGRHVPPHLPQLLPSPPSGKGPDWGPKKWGFRGGVNVLTTGKERGCVLLIIIIFNGNFFK